jgi:putative FmdB family regulatory protein
VPIYDYFCPGCGTTEERHVRVEYRDDQRCLACLSWLERQVAAPLGRIAGRVVQGGGPDRFTADVLGIPLKDLPDGLKTK